MIDMLLSENKSSAPHVGAEGQPKMHGVVEASTPTDEGRIYHQASVEHPAQPTDFSVLYGKDNN